MSIYENDVQRNAGLDIPFVNADQCDSRCVTRSVTMNASRMYWSLDRTIADRRCNGMRLEEGRRVDNTHRIRHIKTMA